MYRYLIKSVIPCYDGIVVRAYIYLRFKIINPAILNAMLSYIPSEGRLSILGCGFGLFDLLIALRYPQKAIRGYDLSESRIAAAKRAAQRLRLRNNTFEVRDLASRDLVLGPCDQILLLDILHHIPPEAQQRLIAAAHESLSRGGCLVIKDIHTHSRPKLWFTWLLDCLMTKGERVWYQSEEYWVTLLEENGFAVVSIRLPDLLPYPHILFVCHKLAESGV